MHVTRRDASVILAPSSITNVALLLAPSTLIEAITHKTLQHLVWPSKVDANCVAMITSRTAQLICANFHLFPFIPTCSLFLGIPQQFVCAIVRVIANSFKVFPTYSGYSVCTM